SGRTGSRTSRGSPAASPPGGPPAIRSSVARHRPAALRRGVARRSAPAPEAERPDERKYQAPPPEVLPGATCPAGQGTASFCSERDSTDRAASVRGSGGSADPPLVAHLRRHVLRPRPDLRDAPPRGRRRTTRLGDDG